MKKIEITHLWFIGLTRTATLTDVILKDLVPYDNNFDEEEKYEKKSQ